MYVDPSKGREAGSIAARDEELKAAQEKRERDQKWLSEPHVGEEVAAVKHIHRLNAA